MMLSIIGFIVRVLDSEYIVHYLRFAAMPSLPMTESTKILIDSAAALFFFFFFFVLLAS